MKPTNKGSEAVKKLWKEKEILYICEYDISPYWRVLRYNPLTYQGTRLKKCKLKRYIELPVKQKWIYIEKEK